MKLNEKGQCPQCKKKPIKYVRDNPGYLCARCGRRYDMRTGSQVENFLWKLTPGGDFMKKLPYSAEACHFVFGCDGRIRI